MPRLYFAASGPDQVKLLRAEKVDHILVSIAKWRRRFSSLPGGVHYVIDSGAYTNTRPGSKDRVSLEDYEDIRDNELKKGFGGAVDYIIMFDDPTSREKTIQNWYRHVEKGHDNAAFVDHIAFFGQRRDEVEKIYKVADRVAISLPATPIEAKARPGAKSETLARDELFKRLEITLELAKKHRTKTHLFAVIKPAILERFKFDAVDTAVWRNGSIYGNCFIYRRDQEGKIRPHWANYHAPAFKEFMTSRFKQLGLDPSVDLDRDRFNVKSLKAYEKFLNGDSEALQIIRKSFEFEAPSGTSVFDFGDLEEKNGRFLNEEDLREFDGPYMTEDELRTMKGPKYPGLKMPSPGFNMQRLKAGQETGVLSRLERDARVGMDQALVNEIMKPGDDPLLFAIVRMEPGQGPFAHFGSIPKKVLDGIDEFSRREFQSEHKIWYHPFKLVRAFDPPLLLKKPVPGRRYATDVDLTEDVREKRDSDEFEVPEELLRFTVQEDKLIGVGVEEIIEKSGVGPEWVLAIPGMARPWLFLPLDSGIESKAQEQAAEIIRERRSEVGFVCKRIGGHSKTGLPVFAAQFKMSAFGNGIGEDEQVLATSPEDLKSLSDEALGRFSAYLHRFFAATFAGNDQESAEGMSREDVVNAYLFVLQELRRRGREIEPKDQLDSEAKDLDPSIFKAARLPEIDESDLAPIAASGEKTGRRIELKEVLEKIKPFRFRQDAIMLVGGLANHGFTDNDIDILIRGPLDEDTRHVLKFRLGRMLGPDLSKRIQFLDDELGGPFTNHVPLGNLTFECHPEFAVKQMRDVAKQDDPLQDLPKEPGKRDSVFQLHFRGKGVHGDLRLNMGDYLIGWTLALGKPKTIGKPVTTIEEAKTVARGYDVETGNNYLKPFLAPGGVYATPKSRQPTVWTEIEADVFDPGEVGATRNFPAVFLAIDKPKVEFGRQSDRFHEYFFSGGKVLNGVMLFRELVSGGEEIGGTPQGEPFWRMFLSKTFLPSILRSRTVKEGVMPPDGFSWLPKSLEQDVPSEFRYWEKRGAEAKKIRDALVETGIFNEKSVQLVDGEIRLVKSKSFVQEEESLHEVSVGKELKSVDYTLSRQSFRGPMQVRSGFTRVFWWLALDRPGERGVMAWKLQTDPSSDEERITALRPDPQQTSDKELLTLQGDIEPGSRFNNTKATPSNISIVTRGKVQVLDQQDGFLKLQFASGPLKGVKVLEAEEAGSDIWQLMDSAKPGEPLNKWSDDEEPDFGEIEWLEELEKGLKPPWGSPAGKFYSAHKIVQFFPEHKRFVEPFAGSAAVFWAKEPSEHEVLGDIDDGIARAFMFLKLSSEKEQLELAKLPLFGNKELYEALKQRAPGEGVLAFHRWLYLKKFSRLCAGEDQPYQNGKEFNTSLEWVIEHLLQYRDRMKNTEVVHGDWRETINRFDGPDTLFYLDPPYPGSKVNDVKGEVGPTLKELAGLLSKIKGKWVLSLPKSEEAEREFQEFHISEVKTQIQYPLSERGKTRSELVITSFPAQDPVSKAVPMWDGMQVWNPDEKQADLDRKMLEPLAIFAPMKPAEGFFKPEELLDKWAKPSIVNAGLAVEPKFNGYRSILEMKDGKPLIYFEDSKENRARVLPDVVKEMKEIESKIGPFIFDAELIDFDEEGNAQPRRTLGRFNGNEVQDDANVRFQVFGTLFLNGKNKTAVPYDKLRGEMEDTFKKLGKLQHFNLVESKTVRTPEGLAEAIDWATDQVGSEGAMIKMLESTYTLGRITDSWTKMKAVRAIKAIVWTRELKKPSPQQRSPAQTYVYECAVGPIPEKDIGEYDKTVKIGDAWYALIGRTFATNVKVEPGHTIEVEFTEMLVDDGSSDRKKRVHWFTPVVVGAAEGKPATFNDAIALAFAHERRKFVDKILEKRLPIIKGDEKDDERFVYGIVLEPETVDAQKDIYSAEEIRNAAHRFMEEFRHLGLMHRTRLDGRLKILETYIAPQDLTINGQRVRKGTWLMAVRVLDNALWQAVKEGKLTGFSIGGSAIRKPTSVEVA